MDAEAVVGDLLATHIIDGPYWRSITEAKDTTQQNKTLHRCLKEKCSLDALMSVCDIIMAVKGNPKMVALGSLMMRRLETGVCVCAADSLNQATSDLVCIHLCTTVCCDDFDETVKVLLCTNH